MIGAGQRIPVLEALKAVTVYAAYQYHEEQEKGTIAKGKCADFVILDRNPLETDENQLADIQVLRTVKENQIVYQKNEIERAGSSCLHFECAAWWAFCAGFSHTKSLDK